jgi:hypothetical protein
VVAGQLRRHGPRQRDAAHRADELHEHRHQPAGTGRGSHGRRTMPASRASSRPSLRWHSAPSR